MLLAKTKQAHLGAVLLDSEKECAHTQRGPEINSWLPVEHKR